MPSKRNYFKKDGDALKEIGFKKGAQNEVFITHSSDTLAQSYDKASRLVSEAIKLRGKGDDVDARNRLVEASDIIASIAENLPKSSKRRKELENTLEKYTAEIENLEKEINREAENPSENIYENGSETVNKSFYKDQVNITRKEDMSDFPSLKDVIGLEDAKEKLEFELDFPLAFPELSDAMTGSKAILLYGPPGNGKTELVRAIAKDKKVNLIEVRPSNIFDKYVGESAKYLRGVFEKAYENEPSIIFIDEIDSIGSTRNSDENATRRDVKNELLIQMEGFASKPKRKVWVVGNTNRPEDLDPALAGRRFPTSRQIYVGLPDKKDRIKLLESKLTKNLPKSQRIDDSVDYDKLSDLLENYSGSDIRNVVDEVRNKPLNELHKKYKEGGLKERKLRAITMKDFEDVILLTPPSVDIRDADRIRKWGDRNRQKLGVN